MDRERFVAPVDDLMPWLSNAVTVSIVKPEIQKAIRKIENNPNLVLENLKIIYFHHKPCTNCRIVYHLFLEDKRELVAYGEIAPLLKERKVYRKRRTDIPSLNMIFYILPADKALPGLKHVMNTDWLFQHLQLFCPEEDISGWTLRKKDLTISIVNYRPRSRCLVKIEMKLKRNGKKRKSTHYAKITANPISIGWLKSLQALSNSGHPSPLLVPQLTGISEKNRIVFYQSVKGIPLLEALKKGDAKRIIKIVCRSLYTIHSTKVFIKETRGLKQELEDLKNCFISFRNLDKHLGYLAKDIFRSLSINAFGLKNWIECTIHGDFSHEQILVKGKKIFILDFDRLGLGDPKSDLGNFIANIMEARISGKIEKQMSKYVIKKCVSGYDRLGNHFLDGNALKWHTAASLMRLAMRPLRRAEADWKEKAKKILHQTKRILEGKSNYLFPIESDKITQPHKPLSVTLREELESDQSPKKIWPMKNGTMLFLYENNESGLPFYKKIAINGEIHVSMFPEDNILTKLPDVINKKRVEDSFKRKPFLPYNFSENLSISKIKILSYKPEHRCQLEFTVHITNKGSEPVKLYGKVYPRLKGARFISKAFNTFMTSLSKNNRNDFPPLPDAFLIPELNLVVTPQIPGTGFNEILDKNQGQKTIENIARSLVAFHGVPFNPLRKHLWEDEVKVMMQWMSAGRKVYPTVAAWSSLVFEHILSREEKYREPKIGPIHRDFYDKQVIVHGNVVTFLDFDTLACGEPEIDVGNFIAHLILRGIQVKEDPWFYRPIIQQFVDTYIKLSDRNIETKILLYTASSLFRLAFVHVLRPGGRLIFFPLLKEVEKALNLKSFL